MPQPVHIRHFKIPRRTIQYLQDGLKELGQTKDPMQVKAFLGRHIEEVRGTRPRRGSPGAWRRR